MNIIFSVYNTSRSLANNARNHQALSQRLQTRGFTFVETSGCYKGEIEKGFMVDCPSTYKLEREVVEEVRRIAEVWDQESILFITDSNTCFLEYLDTGRTERIGQWTKITPEECSWLDAYTQVTNGEGFNYFIAK